MRVWSHPSGLSNTFIAVGDDGFVVANPRGAEAHAAARGLVEAGGISAGAGLSAARVVMFAAMGSATLNLTGGRISLVTPAVKGPRGKLDVEFPVDGWATEVAAEMRSRLGDGWAHSEQRLSVVGAGLKPVLWLGVTAVVTLGAWVMARTAESGGTVESGSGRRGKSLAMIAQAIGPTWVAVIGGVVAAVILAVLVVRMRNPPVIAKFVRR